MNESEEDRLLALCPRCTYALRGLPVLHRCPECGLEVDRRWQVFGGRTIPEASKKVARPLIGFLFVWLGIASLGSLLPLLLGGLPQPLGFMVPVLVYSAIGLAFWAMLRKPKGFVAIGPDGLLIYRGRNRFERIAFDQIETIRHDLGFKRLRLLIHHQPPRFIDHFTFFGPHVFEADRCIRGVKTAILAEGLASSSHPEKKKGGMTPAFDETSKI